MTMRLMEWGDDLLGRQVLYFDTGLRDSGKPRTATIVGPGAEKGCVDVLVMGRGQLDSDRHATFPSRNVILGLSIKDKPPGNSVFALLRDETSILSLGKPASATAEEPAGKGNAVSTRTLPAFGPDARKAADEAIELEETDLDQPERADTIDLDESEVLETEEPKKPTKPKPAKKGEPFEKPKTASELLAEYIKGAKLGKAASLAITGDMTLDVGLQMGDEVAYLIRATYNRGWTFKHIDKSGRFTIDAGIDPAVLDLDIKTMVAMWQDLIVTAADAAMDAGSGNQFAVVSAAMKKKMAQIRETEYIPG